MPLSVSLVSVPLKQWIYVCLVYTEVLCRANGAAAIVPLTLIEAVRTSLWNVGQLLRLYEEKYPRKPLPLLFSTSYEGLLVLFLKNQIWLKKIVCRPGNKGASTKSNSFSRFNFFRTGLHLSGGLFPTHRNFRDKMGNSVLSKALGMR